MDSKNNTNEENNSYDETSEDKCSKCGSININWQGICHDCLTCSYVIQMMISILLKKHLLKYMKLIHRGFDFHGYVEFNENTKLTLPGLKN